MASNDSTNVVRPAQFAREPVCNPSLRGPKRGTLSFMTALRKRRAVQMREAPRRVPRETLSFRSAPGDRTTRDGDIRVDGAVDFSRWLRALRAAGLVFVRDERNGTYVVVRLDDPRLIVHEHEQP